MLKTEMSNRKTHLSFSAFLWALILIGWGAWMLYLVVTRNTLLYVHPRMVPYIIIAGFLFLVLGVAQLYHAFPPVRLEHPPVLRFGYIVFLLPLVLTAFAGPQGLRETAAQTRLLREGPTTGTPPWITKKIEDILASVPPEKVLFLNDAIYVTLAEDMLNNPNKYEGRRVSFIGFVHRTPGLEQDRVFITRMMVTCCVADSEPIGILASSEGVEKLQNTEWVQVTGKIEIVNYKNPYTAKEGPAPLVRVEKAEIGKKPESPYVYPGQF